LGSYQRVMPNFLLDPSTLKAEKAPDLRAEIKHLYLMDEQDFVQALIDSFPEPQEEAFEEAVRDLISGIRDQNNHTVLHKLLQEYDLSTDEGITLMCLAESLIRVPDIATANDLLIDKLSERGWQHHVNKSDSFWVNAASWGLAISGRLLKPKQPHPSEAVKGLVNKLTLNITREAVARAIRIMGEQFVFAQTIEEACEQAAGLEASHQCCSFDMLGEEALTEEDASRYLESYLNAIEAVAHGNKFKKSLPDNVSIKLSALHPRYLPSQQHKVLGEMVTRLLTIARKAKALNVPITIDAEEQYRLDFSLQIIESVISHQDLANWPHFGVVVQSYGKRAMSVLHWLHALADKLQKAIPVRLVKGAYWDSEIKWAQEQGLTEYPVLTQKASTDLHYMACARFLLHPAQEWLRPKFATHNAFTVQHILDLQSIVPFEFQRLQGMGEHLYQQILQKHGVSCRIYAPVGQHKELLPYLVRRLIENGANSSFVFQVQDPQAPISHLVEHPADQLSQSSILNPNVPLPCEIFVDYPNSQGVELQHDSHYYQLMDKIIPYHEEVYDSFPVIQGHEFTGLPSEKAISPCDGEVIGRYHFIDNDTLDFCVNQLQALPFHPPSVESLARIVDDIGQHLYKHRHELMYLLMKEAGKTLENAIGEIREAIDFCRYYSRQAQKNFADPTILDSVTGEENLLRYRPRGNVLCISPWNFPLAIYVGQIAAALSCGNRVIAKPAQQTSLVAHRVMEIMFEAGISHEQLYFLPGAGAQITQRLIESGHVDMVCFTGSTQAAKQIQSWLIDCDNGFIPFLAETGGQNVMFADSTALIEQLVKDVITSAFDSSGQRCSALRVLYLQKDIEEPFYQALKGRLECLNLESPFLRDTDIGPIIDDKAKRKLNAHLDWLGEHGEFVARATLPNRLPSDNYFAPCAYKIESIKQLKEEVFGPILHIISYDHDELDAKLEEVKATQYELTLGIHSRNQRWIDYIVQQSHVGNIYINRNMVGAKVGAQPFGGHGLSGTGPKAGGPNYVHAFVKEYTVTTNTVAFGGNQELLS